MKKPETIIVEKIIAAFKRLPGSKTIKLHGNPFMESGSPDLIGAWRGKPFAIEVKQPGEKPEPIQARRLNEWAAAGALTGCAHNVAEALSIIGAFAYIPSDATGTKNNAAARDEQPSRRSASAKRQRRA